MLINLWIEPVNNKLAFDLPPITFHSNQLVRVSKLYIRWGSQVGNAALALLSTLIDKSSSNPSQQLLFVYQRSNSKHLCYTPTQNEYYKIQCLDLQSSEFILIDKEHNHLEKIEKIFLQLEIIDERLQQFST